MTVKNNRREYDRIPVKIPAIAYINKDEYDCIVENISVTGMCVSFDNSMLKNFMNIDHFDIQFMDDIPEQSDKNNYFVMSGKIIIKHIEYDPQHNEKIYVGGIVNDNNYNRYFEYVCLKGAIRHIKKNNRKS